MDGSSSKGRLRHGMLACWTLGFLYATGSQAGEVEFRAGGRIVLPVSVAGDRVELRLPEKVYTFDRADFLRVSEEPTPAEEWSARASAALDGTPDERYAAITWGVERGLTRQAIELLEQSLKLDPDHEPTARLGRQLGRLKPALPTPPPPKLPGGSAGPFSTALSDHLVLLHQHDPQEATERLATLEQVFVSYYLAMAEHEIRVELPPTRLVLAWFARPGDYREFLRAEGASAFLTTEGYYHPTRHFVAFFDQRGSARGLRSAATIAQERKPLEDPARSGLDADELQKRAHAADRLELLEIARRQQAELGTAAHELIHLLVWSSGLAPRLDRFPYWLHEGLAMQFEVVAAAGWSGISPPHRDRLKDWLAFPAPPRLLPLAHDDGFGRGFDRARYTQAWALVYFLRTQHPDVFVSLIDRLRIPRPAGDAAPWPSILQAAWGRDLISLEQDWVAFITRLAREQSAWPAADQKAAENQPPLLQSVLNP